ncbi:alkaline phosphatase-like [Oppia nitens]|uniref:alkaline phosphatase-like n=1 Tax=Oppia nitens TaxID=1686743 RepID=UPI0023DCD179|nr:alkaline phosphatase-like [Oppia nitens]
MGITTVTAARILKGQQLGLSGEEHQLSFDDFPNIALSKTYTIDSQVGDSGACATALLNGVKARYETIGLDENGFYEDCHSSFNSRVKSIADWALEEGKATGIVTTTRVTHATPAALYAHSASRYWESDDKLPPNARTQCKDIARQLVEEYPGRDLNVILGGGRRHFISAMDWSTQRPNEFGRRLDNRNLIDNWLRDKKDRDLKASYVKNKLEFDSLNTTHIDYLLGLFSHNHMAHEVDRETDGPTGEPSLAEMTTKAIEVLRHNPNGYFLLVESGRIDHAHHLNNAKRALVDTLALDEAIQAAIKLTHPSNTLLVVTADHSHVFTFGGSPKRGNHILGTDSKPSDVDSLHYTTLLYANGPGYTRKRINISTVDTTINDYIQESAVPRRWDTHGGEDVPVYAQGVNGHVFRGVVEQTFIPYAISYAACMGPFKWLCEKQLNRQQQQHLNNNNNCHKQCHNQCLMPSSQQIPKPKSSPSYRNNNFYIT